MANEQYPEYDERVYGEETQTKPVEVTMEIKAISIPKSVVLTVNAMNEERWIPVVQPANIQYAKKGKAKIRIDPQSGNIIYLRMESFAPKKQYPYPPKQGFNQATQYHPFSGSGQSNYKEYTNEVAEMEGITLLEFKQTYNDINTTLGQVTASQLFPISLAQLRGKVEIDRFNGEKDKDNGVRLYDAIIYYKKEKKVEEQLPDY